MLVLISYCDVDWIKHGIITEESKSKIMNIFIMRVRVSRIPASTLEFGVTIIQGCPVKFFVPPSLALFPLLDKKKSALCVYILIILP